MKIIIADDEFANRLLISEIVRDLGHELIEAENGVQAISMMEQYSDIDLILMDIEMPVMNGMEAARQIRERFLYPKNQIPIVAITGHNQGIFPEDCQHVGFDCFLTKPYSIDKFTQLLESYSREDRSI
ncbi:MAG: response regulator [Bacteroidales bacterium]|nr:response regulator [Bacteroidales bacterium]